MKPIVEACIPLYGAGARFRVYLRYRSAGVSFEKFGYVGSPAVQVRK